MARKIYRLSKSIRNGFLNECEAIKSHVYCLGEIGVMDVASEAREGYLLATVSGPFDYASAAEAFKQVAAATDNFKCTRVLLDVTGVTGEIGIMDRHDLGIGLASLQKHFTRIAIVARPDQLLPDRFMLNVVRNRGLNGAAFANLTEAEAWLTQE